MLTRKFPLQYQSGKYRADHRVGACRIARVFALGLAALVAIPLLGPIASGQVVVPAGSGQYYATPPAGQPVPAMDGGAPAIPQVTANFVGPKPTNKWWSSLIWKRFANNAFGFPMYPHPLALRAATDGLNIGYITTPTLYTGGYSFDLNPSSIGVKIGVDGMTSPDVKVDDATDWTVSAVWSGNGRTLRSTFGQGLPYAYFTKSGGDATASFNTTAGALTVYSSNNGSFGIRVGSVNYGVFGPAGSTWTRVGGATGSVFRSNLNGQNYFSVAALPDATVATFELFRSRAHVAVTGGRVSWSYDPAAAEMVATYNFATTVKEGAATTPLVAMLRHQYLHSTTPTTALRYTTARGQMRLADAASFTTRYPFAGVLPALPDAGGLTPAQLYSLVNSVYQESNPLSAQDTYFGGKAMARLAHLLPLADEAGHTAAKTRFLDLLRREMTEWLTISAPTNTGRDAYSAIQGESYNTSTTPLTVVAAPTGQAIAGVTGGTVIKFTGVNFGQSRPGRILIKYFSTSTGSGSIQFRADSPTGTILGGGGVGGTAGQWQEIAVNTIPSAFNTISGVRDLYLTVTTPYIGELFRLDSFYFDRGTTTADRFFYYEPVWGTLLGSNGSFGLAAEMNDHHFHYGYFLQTAAMLAQYDPVWAAQYGPMVNLLIADVASTDIPTAASRFPRFRNYDVYAGHSLAGGSAAAAAGNNQESSSESINFSTGLILWAAATGNTQLRDLGMFLYSSEAQAIEQYWFDADQAVFPPGTQTPVQGIVWSNGAVYATWFTADPDLIQGINLLPIQPGSVHLGMRPDMINRAYDYLVTRNAGGPPNDWQGINWSGLALANPARAAALLAATPAFTNDDGNSSAHTQHWIKNLNQLGTLDMGVRANWPHANVFIKAGVRTFIAWNPTAAPVNVAFSNGAHLCVPPGQMVKTTAPLGCIAAACSVADLVGPGGNPPGDGILDGDDFIAFINAFSSDGPLADIVGGGGTAPGDGVIDGNDFIAFINGFGAGC